MATTKPKIIRERQTALSEILLAWVSLLASLFCTAGFFAILWIAVRCLREWEALRYDRTKTTRMQETVEAAEEAVEDLKGATAFYGGQAVPPAPTEDELRAAIIAERDLYAANSDAYPSTEVNEEHIPDDSPPSVPPTNLYASAWMDES